MTMRRNCFYYFFKKNIYIYTTFWENICFVEKKTCAARMFINLIFNQQSILLFWLKCSLLMKDVATWFPRTDRVFKCFHSYPTCHSLSLAWFCLSSKIKWPCLLSLMLCPRWASSRVPWSSEGRFSLWHSFHMVVLQPHLSYELKNR